MMQNSPYEKDVPEIVYAADDKFAEMLGVSLVSLFHNNRDMHNINLYILDSGISGLNKEKIEQVCKLYNREPPCWIVAKNISKELSMEVAIDRGSLSQYARLFVSSILPEGLKRVLYLDCDIVVNQSIKELWNLDLHGKIVGALMDAFSKYYRMNIDLKPDDIMFNSGVMLIDLEKWKEKKIEKKLLNFIKSKKGKIQQGDQGALNAILYNDVYCFEPRFNSITIFYDFTYEEMMFYRKPPDFYPEPQIEKAVADPVIIHFTSSFMSRRPWMCDCRHRYVEEWIKYKNLSPWKDSALHGAGRKKWFKAVYGFFARVLPRTFMINVSGILQAYGRPVLLKIKYR